MAPSKLPYWPAALRRDQAAAYCGLSVPTFTPVCPVRPIEFTQSPRGRRWLRVRLDAWLASLDPNSPDAGAPRRSLADRIGAPAQPTTSGIRRFGGNVIRETKIAPLDQEALEREWEKWAAALKKRPLGKRERDALEAYFTAKASPSEPHVPFGAWRKLRARGFIAEINEGEKPRGVITSTGEAEWLRI